jgi:hypothetical protein
MVYNSSLMKLGCCVHVYIVSVVYCHCACSAARTVHEGMHHLDLCIILTYAFHTAQMLGKLYALVDEQCCEDNPDALTSHEVHQFSLHGPAVLSLPLCAQKQSNLSRTVGYRPDNDTNLNDAQVLLPGHLLMRFTREKLEDCLAALKDGIARDAARSPEAVNLQVGCYLRCMLHAACMQLNTHKDIGDCMLVSYLCL